MVRMTVLASGSRGNSTVVSSSRTRLLVDAGVSCRELFKRMQAVGEDPRTLDAIVTHEHQDHVQGLAVTARKLGIPVYFTEATHRAWIRWVTPRKRMTYAEWLAERKQQAESRAAAPVNPQIDDQDAFEEEQESLVTEDTQARPDPAALPIVQYFTAGEGFSIGDIAVTPFTIPHDAADPVGFVFEAEDVRIGLATDLGYMPAHAAMRLRRCDILMLESNHDLDMLRDGPYPWSVKQRVMSRVGHLSNHATAEFLEKSYDGYAAYVILAHLSESNNLPELALVSAERALQDRMSLLGNRVLLATQDEPLASIVL
jgi:phosphoribosyl 1,2-cyclic phosphodiesterase